MRENTFINRSFAEKNVVVNSSSFKALCETIPVLIDKHLGSFCQGFYIYGSIFSETFVKESSDIDFSVFLNTELDEDIYNRIQCFHKELNFKAELAQLLEGEYYYLDPNDIWSERKTVLVEHNKLPTYDVGTIDPDIVELIRDKGMVVYGNKAHKVLPYVNCEMICRYFTRYIKEFLEEFENLKKTTELFWHKIPNICRAYYYLINQNYIDKSVSVYWMLKKFPEYTDLLKKSLRIRANVEKATLSLSEEGQILNLVSSLLLPRTNYKSSLQGLCNPMRTEIQTTTRCNCSCPHCGYFTINQKSNIDTENIGRFLNELKTCWGWVDRVLFEGGEPTCDMNSLLSSIAYAKELKIPNIQINTNLVDVSKEDLLNLIKAGCNYIEVSVDAVSEELWLNVRGLCYNEDNHKKYIQFMDMLIFICDYPDVVVDFNYTPYKLNINEIANVYRFACENGARFFSFQNLVCTTKEIQEMVVSVNDLITGLKVCESIGKEFSFPPTILLCCFEAIENSEKLLSKEWASFIEPFKCSKGKQYIYLNHKNMLRTCCFGDKSILGKYIQGELENILEKRNNKYLMSCPICQD